MREMGVSIVRDAVQRCASEKLSGHILNAIISPTIFPISVISLNAKAHERRTV